MLHKTNPNYQYFKKMWAYVPKIDDFKFSDTFEKALSLGGRIRARASQAIQGETPLEIARQNISKLLNQIEEEKAEDKRVWDGT